MIALELGLYMIKEWFHTMFWPPERLMIVFLGVVEVLWRCDRIHSGSGFENALGTRRAYAWIKRLCILDSKWHRSSMHFGIAEEISGDVCQLLFT
ncbi:hypothetical protein C451_00505 [Halococcus thailandensis JCM 13552]|uniref:Uncharacterized protein n=1 Tax=Halococcus thailandensis JCM 13552 TaxID=1227457 RepID=M0NIA8_9EURY|nr:hypothetical protein C451_00505 [Halococcus thailandensis JCM 13552]